MKKAVAIGLSILAILLASGFLLLRWCSSPAGGGRDCIFTVERGWGAGRISNALSDSGLVRCPPYFLWKYSRAGEGRILQAGTYRFDGGMTPDSILTLIINGEVVPVPTHWVTLAPGLTLEQTLAVISDDLDISLLELDSLASDADLLTELGVPGLEGYMFPETYEFADSLGAGAVVERIVETGFAAWPDSALILAEELGLGIDELIVLASIVEREARVDEERSVIAGVFLSRLRREMHLESCATVQYALGEVREVLLYRDLEIESPYNTYKYAGLPPGPICSPGAASLAASFMPDTTEGYLYFVSRGDGSGTHLFATTYSGHLANQRRVSSGTTD